MWVSCEGENPADVENIRSRDYYPRMGFPHYYFPFKNIEGYIPPIVAVQFTVESKYMYNIQDIMANANPDDGVLRNKRKARNSAREMFKDKGEIIASSILHYNK